VWVKVVLCSESVEQPVESHVKRLTGLRVAVVSDHLFRTFRDGSQPGVLALVQRPSGICRNYFAGAAWWWCWMACRPRNAGTIARAAEAFGASGIMFLKGSVSPFNPKALRAAAGSLFACRLLTDSIPHRARGAQQNKLDVYAGGTHAMPGSPPSPSGKSISRANAP